MFDMRNFTNQAEVNTTVLDTVRETTSSLGITISEPALELLTSKMSGNLRQAFFNVSPTDSGRPGQSLDELRYRTSVVVGIKLIRIRWN